MKEIIFKLPPKGALEENSPDDPLKYYYGFFTGALYRGRIAGALTLLDGKYNSVLEVGYGSGVFIPTLAGIAGLVSGIDIQSDPDSVSRNLSRLGVKASLFKGDMLDADYLPDSFDLVVAISIFEHINRPKALFEKIHRVLKPGGHLLVGVPRVNNFMAKCFSLIGFKGIENHHVSGHRKVIMEAQSCFKLEKFRVFPRILPEACGLYFNMLFIKK